MRSEVFSNAGVAGRTKTGRKPGKVQLRHRSFLEADNRKDHQGAKNTKRREANGEGHGSTRLHTDRSARRTCKPCSSVFVRGCPQATA